MPLLIDNRQTAEMSPEARGLFGRGGSKPTPDDPWVAVVAPGPLLRVTVKFVLRTAQTTTFKLFFRSVSLRHCSSSQAIASCSERRERGLRAGPAHHAPVRARVDAAPALA